MAGKERKTAHDLNQFTGTLAAKPYVFGFFAALRRMECLYAERPRIGTSAHPADDPVRLGQEPFMTFAPADLTAFEPASDTQPHRLAVRFLGLLGPNGPLPLHLTEYARQRLRQHADHTFIRFLDIFHHRMLTLFYRAWANNEPTVSFDRPDSDWFADYVGAFAGLGMASLRKRDAISDLTKFYYCGRLAGQTRSAEGLEDILNDYFRLPVRIIPFVGEWVALPEENVCRLGLNPVNGTLGLSTMVGERVWGCQHKFRITLGPLSLADYQSLLPVGERIGRLVALVRNYIGDELAWEVRLVLKREQVPAMCLDDSTRLGWTTWLGDPLETNDPNDLTFDAMKRVVPNGEENTHDRNQP
jgi:type VI secretion system protein ImpH